MQTQLLLLNCAMGRLLCCRQMVILAMPSGQGTTRVRIVFQWAWSLEGVEPCRKMSIRSYCPA